MTDEHDIPPHPEEPVEGNSGNIQEPPATSEEIRPAEKAELAEASTIDEVEQDYDSVVLAESRKHTRRSFAVAAVSAVAGYGFYRWIDRSDGDMMQPRPLRRANYLTSRVARNRVPELVECCDGRPGSDGAER